MRLYYTIQLQFIACIACLAAACGSPSPATDGRVDDARSADGGNNDSGTADRPNPTDLGVVGNDAAEFDAPSDNDGGTDQDAMEFDAPDPADVPNRDVPNGLDIPNRDVPNGRDVPSTDVMRADAGCAPNTADCDRNAANGCETRLDTIMNCGVCGRACTPRANATPTCDLAACRYTCTMGFEDCDGAPANGCEASLASPRSCGRCGNTCGGATPLCNGAMGTCVAACPAGTTNCGGSCINTQNNQQNCGFCGRSCDVQNATSSCTMGMCQLTRCAAGFGNCDGFFANGCETDLNTSAANCGACNTQCFGAAGQFAMCTMGACIRTCAAGRGDCDMNNNNGCETNIDTSVQHCGACGMACNTPRATPNCNNGMCTIGSCNAGFGDCNRMVVDGCEAPLNTVANCGACGRACALANATAACMPPQGCVIAACTMGFGNCDGNNLSGCETNLNTSNQNCGACGRNCRAGTNCVMGMCR
jgi:hypothetical protein